MAYLLFSDNTKTDLETLENNKEIILGSSYECDLFSSEKGVASKHCFFSKDDDIYYVLPFSDKLEIRINADKINAKTKLKNGDYIEIGDEKINFYSESDADAQSESDKKSDIKLKIHKLLIERVNLKKADLSNEILKQRTIDTIKKLCQEFKTEITKISSVDELADEIVDEALGLGAIESFLKNPDITEIMVKNAKNIYIEKKGKLVLSDKKFISNEQLLGVIERIVAPLGRRIDESSPIVDARLVDGSRVNAVIPPVALDGPALTIRKFSDTPFQIADLISFGSMTEEIAKLIEIAVKHRQNIIISGGTGSGKTTLLNVASSFIPTDERIVTVEDSAELKLPQDHVIRLETRPANIEGKGKITIRDLVINCLRMRPDRIVVGECRGGEALDMLQAMNTGHDGSITTIHSNSPKDAMARLETLVLMAGMDLPSKAIREQISMAVNIVVQQSRMADGTRKITHVTEITGINDGDISLEHIFLFKQTGISNEGKIIGHYETTGYVPNFVKELTSKGIKLPLEIFKKQG